MELKQVDVNSLIAYPENARTHNDKQVAQIAESIKEFGFCAPCLVDEKGVLIAGHGRLMAAQTLGLKTIPTISIEHLTPAQVKAYRLADNQLALNAGWDLELLGLEVSELKSDGFNIDLLGFDEQSILGGMGAYGAVGESKGNLSEKFGIPPFSVLNTREGWWQDRRRAWVALGIQSELGRDDNLIGDSVVASINKGTSLFDPVLAEIAYRWFCPPKGDVLDPFAGGSVRGIVAAKLGRKYVGVELRKEQIEANKQQAVHICEESQDCFSVEVSNYQDLTPIEKHGGYLVKRDDLFSIGGVNGGKVRTCWHLAQGAKGLVTAGSRESPQVNIVSHIAQALQIPCRIHTPKGELSAEVKQARDLGAELFQHKAGYNSVIIKRAKDDALENNYREIPFGMECKEAVEATKLQVANIPSDVERIVIPVGSGMSLSGVLYGLREKGLDIPVLGVKVGASPEKRLSRYAPKGWEKMVTLVDAGIDYHVHAETTTLGALTLDPVYEAKCLPFLEKGDLLWTVGIRKTFKPINTCFPKWCEGDSQKIDQIVSKKVDFIFSCPPYADLEVYSDNAADLSTMEYGTFRKAYYDIIKSSCSLLKNDRFACFVVGEVRDKKGGYYNFVGDTTKAFQEAGLSYYNEAILVTAVGTLPIRAGRTFEASRKLGKTHQNVLIFVKGDAAKATKLIGPCEFGDMDAQAE
jgi:1-aminocyclopropane-1-carboxylate deaminase/D-cysteine desulfhydrase-like pyridoxal-dependent ACC family enzyme/DNA modification methylase